VHPVSRIGVRRDRNLAVDFPALIRGIPLHRVSSFVATMGLIVATFAGQPLSAFAGNRSALWAVVHDICLQAYQSISVAFPCAEVNIANGLEQGFVVLQTPSSATHVLVVPTTRISGIESPALLSENAPNYWKVAWDSRRFVEEGAGRRLPRNKIGMAIIRPPVAARSSCIFMSPASPRRSLPSCIATKRRFTKPGLPFARYLSGTDFRQ
jgi:CDP-diacylglycerol pyrophosphatase